MPELPEVETIARRLRRTIIGKNIAAVTLSGFALRRPVRADLTVKLAGRSVRKVLRRGKYLLIELVPRGYWLIHLGMSGRIFYDPPAELASPHTHARVRFSDGSELHYRDHRRFGLLELYELDHPGQVPEIHALGCDPLSSGFTAERLWELLQVSRQPVKSLLLDQRRIAGLGNIYVCEALFRARLHPFRPSCSLSPSDCRRLRRSIRAVLRAALRHRGTSFSDFMDSAGQKGDHQRYLHVYQREGKRCRRCGSRIERIQRAGRSTFFCPKCQQSIG